jgi:release factor glutamine methyltransferase
MTWSDTIRNAASRLSDFGISDEVLNAELLAVYLKGGWLRAEIRPYLQNELSVEEADRYEQLINRRLLHEPLQYITGETEFFGLRLYASPAALIPRPDTEILVEAALHEIQTLSGNAIRILDIGTGSGAIILAIASGFPSAECIGTDISNDALALAERNRKRLGLSNVYFTKDNIFDDVELGSFDVIVSNPPYISLDEMRLLGKEVIDYEPRIALTDETDGLSFYKKIAGKAEGSLLKDGGLLLFEVAYDVSSEVKAILKKSGFRDIQLTNDLSGISRVVSGRKIHQPM